VHKIMTDNESKTIESGADTPPTASFPPEPPDSAIPSAAEGTTSSNTSSAPATEKDLHIFDMDKDILPESQACLSATSSVATEKVNHLATSTAAADSDVRDATLNGDDGGKEVIAAPQDDVDDASIATEDSASSRSSDQSSSGESEESSDDDDSSSSSDDPSEVGGVKIEDIHDSEEEEEADELMYEKSAESDDEDDVEDPMDAVLLKHDVKKEQEESASAQNENSLLYHDEELEYEESMGDVSEMMAESKKKSTKRSRRGRKSTSHKSGLGQDRATVRKMVGQKLRGKGWDSRRRKFREMDRTGLDGALDLESGRRLASERAGGRSNRSRGWTAHYKRRRIWYCCFSVILVIIGVSLLIYGVAKERTISREQDDLDDIYNYDDGVFDDEDLSTPAYSPSRPSIPGGMPTPSVPTVEDKSPVHSSPIVPVIPSPTQLPTPATGIPTISPTIGNTPPITPKPTEKNWSDDAVLSLLKMAYSDAFSIPGADLSLLAEYEGALDPKIYANAAQSEKSIQWRSYEYLSNRSDIYDKNKEVLVMDVERILQIYALMCFYQNFEWEQEGAGECFWTGVTCHDVRGDAHKDVLFPSADDLRVVSLEVSGNGPNREEMPPLEGDLPMELMFLTYLQTLDVSHNKIRGKLSKTAILFWPDMRVLALNDNFFEGDIPSELGELDNLQKLTLHHNEFLGEVPTEVCMLREESLHFLWADCSPMPSTTLAKVSCTEDCCTICFEGYDDDGGPSTGGSSPSTPSETTHTVQNDEGSDLKTKLSDASTDGGMSLMDITTPQFHAYTWLVEDSARSSYSDERLFQRYALATLYFSTAGIQWTKSDGWTTTLDECKWYGVSGCDEADSEKIVSIELFGNNLMGTIPPELFIFIPNVINLNLANNQLRGEIPSEIGKLTKVNILELAENELTGQIPSDIGMLYNADHIFLQSNLLVGEMPWAVCQLRTEKSLTLLWADCRGSNARVKCSVKCCSTCFSSDENSMSASGSDNANNAETTADGDGQPLIENAPNSHNDEEGKVFDVLKKMAPDNGDTLKDSLSPQYKAYSWLVEKNYEPTSDILTIQRYALATLYFATAGAGWHNTSGWMTVDNECSWFGVTACNQRNMVTELALNENYLVGTIPLELSHLRMIESIDLSGNDLYGTIPTQLGWFEELEWLSLADNFLSGNVPSELGNIFTLSEVYLHFNDLEGDVPEQICELRPTAIGESDETTGLIEFWNDCGDDLPQVSCPENCCTRCFTADDAEASYSPTYEPTVIPTMNPTVDDVPALLENDDLRLFLIEHMDGFEDSLSTENIGTAQYEAYLWLANSNNLDELDVFQRVQRFGLVAFYLSTTAESDWKISNRWKTEQSECKWYGITCDDDEITVTEISLPRNRMSGTLPPEIALVGLGGKIEKLDLSSNQIGGAIPPQIGDLKNIEILNLRGNDFEGEVPTEIGNLSKLKILELQSNSLTGPMPSEICALRTKSLEQLGADCDQTNPLDEIICSESCCTTCF